MLTSKQPSAELLEHPFSSARGLQVDWLRREDYGQGMSGELRSKFDEETRKGQLTWQEALAESESKVVMP